MDNNAMNFISFLFNDGDIQTCFKDNTVLFVDNECNAFQKKYNGDMKEFLSDLAKMKIKDTTALCSIPQAAKAALNYIKD